MNQKEKAKELASSIRIPLSPQQTNSLYYSFFYPDDQRLKRLLEGAKIPPFIIGIACLPDTNIPKGGGLTFADLAKETYPQGCVSLSHLAKTVDYKPEKIIQYLLTFQKSAGTQILSYIVAEPTKEQIEAILSSDPLVLINPKNAFAEMLTNETPDVRRIERNDYNLSPNWTPGQILNHGEHGIVIQVVNSDTSQIAVLKTARFANDMEAIRKIGNEGLVLRHIMSEGEDICGYNKLIELGSDYNVLELAPGYPSKELLKYFQITPGYTGAERQIRLTIAQKLAQTVAQLHKIKVTHGDIKLENVMAEISPNGPIVTLVDFELAAINPVKSQYEYDRVNLIQTIFEILTGVDPNTLSTNEAEILLKELGFYQRSPLIHDLALSATTNQSIVSPDTLSSILRPDHTALGNYVP